MNVDTGLRKKIFISYSHKDTKWKDALVNQLKILVLEDRLDVWVDHKIVAGDDWLKEIEDALNLANIAIFLISTDFLISDFIRTKEVPVLLKRMRDEGIRIIPLIIRPCPWQECDWLHKLQARPKSKKTLAEMNKKADWERHLSDFVSEIKRLNILEEQRRKTQLWTGAPEKLKIDKNSIAKFDLESCINKFKSRVKSKNNTAFRVTGEFSVIRDFVIERLGAELESQTKRDCHKIEIDLNKNFQSSLGNPIYKEILKKGYHDFAGLLDDNDGHNIMLVIWNHDIPDHEMLAIMKTFRFQLKKELDGWEGSFVTLLVNHAFAGPLKGNKTISNLDLPEAFDMNEFNDFFTRLLEDHVPVLPRQTIDSYMKRLTSQNGDVILTYREIAQMIR